VKESAKAAIVAAALAAADTAAGKLNLRSKQEPESGKRADREQDRTE
jgi:hypothetical protein